MKRKIGTCIVSLLMTAVMVWHAPLVALAETYYINQGSITITAGTGGQTVNYLSQNYNDPAPVITQNDPNTPTTNTIIVAADAGQTANVTLYGVNIDTSGAAVTTKGEGTVNIELDGTNILKSGDAHAGLEKQDDGHLTIMDANQNGSLEVKGGAGGAGIGGGNGGNASNITINDGTVTATSGTSGAGIGGGANGGYATNITISGNAQVTAKSGSEAAGIGGGQGGYATNITISGNAQVTAESGSEGAGIGGGEHGDASNITISGNAKVTAQGGQMGAGIGGGAGGDATNITISGNAQVTAESERWAAGIGGGEDGAASYITISGNAKVTAQGGQMGAGIGGGAHGDATNITINGGTVTAAGGLSGAGIGGGVGGDATNITISGDAQVKASGGNEYYFGSGAAIGSGGTRVNNSNPVNGTVVLDTNGLTTGSVSLYEPGTTINEMESGTVPPLQRINGTPVTPGPTPVTPVTPMAQGTTPVIPVIPVMPAFSGTGSGGSATPTASVKPVPQTKQNFDSVYYADNNPDLYEAYGYDHDLLWNHYVTVGRQEGRKVRFVEGIHKGAVDEGKGKEDFDAIAYADYYADLFAVYGYDEDALWNHYDTVGRAEGRLYFFRQVS